MNFSMPRRSRLEIAHLLTANPEFYNLPRKFKISVLGCPTWCSYPEINDIALTPVSTTDRLDFQCAWAEDFPTSHISRFDLMRFVLPEQAVAVVKAIAEIFRDQQVLRESRDRARMKYLFMKEGWTAERFLVELQVAARISLCSPVWLRRCPTRRFAIM